MSGMSNRVLDLALGYDDSYVATEDSRRMYQCLLGMPAVLGRFVGMRGNAVAVSAASAHNIGVQKAVDATTECIAKASYRSAVAVRRQQMGAQILGVNEAIFRDALVRRAKNKKAGDV